MSPTVQDGNFTDRDGPMPIQSSPRIFSSPVQARYFDAARINSAR